MPGRVLEGVRVLDLTRVVAGPFATAILADLGALVTKVERPGTGDDYRYGPSKKGETSLSFQNTNRGKRSITLDVRKDEGRELFLRLVERSDVVVENFRAGWMEARGLSADVIQARNPRCFVASLSGFGQTGERAGQASYDIVAQAAGGLMSITGFPDGPPVRAGGAMGDFVGGLYLALGLVAGLRDRDRTGRARALDLSNQDAVFAVTDSLLSIYKGIGDPSGRVGNQHPFTAPYDCFEARDGHVVIATASNRLYRPLCRAIGRPELATDERYRSHRGRAERRAELSDLIGAGAAELAHDPQLVARDMIERHPHPAIGEIYFHGNPLKFSDADPREIALAPDLGQHNAEVYGELGLGPDDLERLAREDVI